MNIACVLRKSAEFGPEHVLWLKRQCERYIPHDLFICFSDVDVPRCIVQPLVTPWPKWWAKMEIYGCPLSGPLLILDLDTVITRRFEPTEAQLEHSWVMRHFTRDGFRAPEEIACGTMLVTEAFRRRVFAHFCEDPYGFIREARDDDQKYFKKYFGRDLKRFQDEFVDEFVSYKLHVLQNGLHEDNTFVEFHGLPRPWNVSAPWIPKLES